MRNVKRVCALVVATLLVAAVAVPALAAPTTVGRFVQELAKVKSLNATDPEIAADSLRSVGVRLPAMDLNKTLTEADVATISRIVGLKVTTSNPDTPFGDEQVDRFFLSFASELGAVPGGDDNATLNCPPGEDCGNPGAGSGPGNGNGGPGFDPFAKGKGKGKGKAKGSRTSTDPE